MRICPQCGAETTALTCRNDGFGTVDANRYRRLDPSHLLGTLFQDRYRVDAVLGSGGMGSVYRATQVRVGRHVALKVINADLAYDLAVVARFQREGRAIATLIHPNIVQVYDFGQTDDGELFMAMELVEGRTLADVIRDEAPLAPERVVHIGAQIFDALAEAHEHGVIHRDLKPDNIFITETGRRHDVVKILDFGVAKIVNEPKSESMVTARGAILGSPKYMAPEQARGKGVTGHADIYATGGILYEALTGRAVFNEPSPADYLVAHSVKVPNAPAVSGRELRGPIVDLVMKCLEKKPWNRPDGAARALEAIEAARLAPVVAPDESAEIAEDEAAVVAESERAPEQEAVAEAPTGAVIIAGEADVEVEATVEASEAPVSVPPPMPSEAPSAETAPAPPGDEVETEVAASDGIAAERAEHPARVQVPTPLVVVAEEPSERLTEPLPALDTRRLGTTAETVTAREAAQSRPTVAVKAVDTKDALRTVTVHHEHRAPERTGGLWLLAALLLLFVGAFVYLAANDFFRGGPVEGPRVAGTTHTRGVVEDPIQPATLDPAQPNPNRTTPVAAAADDGPIPGEMSAPGAGGTEVGEAGDEATAKAGDEATAKTVATAKTEASDEATAKNEATTKTDTEATAKNEATTKTDTEATAKNEATTKTDTEATAKDEAADEAAGKTDTEATAKSEGPSEPADANVHEPAWVEVAKDQQAQEKREKAKAAAKPTVHHRRAETTRTTPPRHAARRPTSAPTMVDPLAGRDDPDFPQRTNDADDNIHRVIVDSTPSGANIKMGSLPLGKTPLRVEWKDIGQPVHVTITKDGYYPHHITLSSAQAKVGVRLRPMMIAPGSR